MRERLVAQSIRSAKSTPFFALLCVLALIGGCTSINRAIPFQTPPPGLSRAGFIRPISGKITSGFGVRTLRGKTQMHKGVDFAETWFVTPVFAAKDGVVSVSAVSESFGRWIEIRHSGGLATRYGHLSWRHVSEGDRVQQGDLIGRIGDSGHSTATHLHFEVLQGGQQFDPMRILPP
jgi:murein DD-endopeptidase MepM/ murein hydrolase activator NlpD